MASKRVARVDQKNRVACGTCVMVCPRRVMHVEAGVSGRSGHIKQAVRVENGCYAASSVVRLLQKGGALIRKSRVCIGFTSHGVSVDT